MNRFNPEKLLLSKWTAKMPQQDQKHFIVSRLIRDADDNITGCELEAVINKKLHRIDWRQLQDESRWIMGWK